MEVAHVVLQQVAVQRRDAAVAHLRDHPLEQLALQGQLRPDHQKPPVVRGDWPGDNLVGEEHRVHVVGFLPATDELRFDAHGLAGDHVLDLADLVVTLIAADHLLEHAVQLVGLPG
ncbi:hypothetical protein D9M68_778700 [compost metagenome]